MLHQQIKKISINATIISISCNEKIFSTVHRLLLISISLSVTTASSERSVSTL